MLVAIDGEPHTDAAIVWALSIAAERGYAITAVHVKDIFLKQFSSEIYAQGREEYLDHVERCLAAQAADAVSRFSDLASANGVEFDVKIRDGEPIAELVDESRKQRYDMLVVGRKALCGFAAWKSRDLPGRLATRPIDIPVVFIPRYHMNRIKTANHTVLV